MEEIGQTSTSRNLNTNSTKAVLQFDKPSDDLIKTMVFCYRPATGELFLPPDNQKFCMEVFPALPNETATTSEDDINPPSPLLDPIHRAANEFNVPERLLLAIANQYGLGKGSCDNEAAAKDEHYAGYPTYGPFHFTDELLANASFYERKINAPEVDCDLNLSARIQAKLLSDKFNPSDVRSDPATWLLMLRLHVKDKFPTLGEPYWNDLATEIFRQAENGFEGVDSWGNVVKLTPISNNNVE